LGCTLLVYELAAWLQPSDHFRLARPAGHSPLPDKQRRLYTLDEKPG
jgi:hypothetical protein